MRSVEAYENKNPSPDETSVAFEDPVAYLADLGIDAVLVATHEAPMPEAA